MRSNSGFTMIEMLIVMALIGILSAIAIPPLMGSTARNSVWTASEQIGSQIRQARLKAISRNRSFRIRFDCPAVGQYRVLVVTGDATVDGAADRCDTTLQFDSGIYTMPSRVTYNDPPPTLTVNPRGIFTSTGAIPATITVSYDGGSSRSLNMSATGQVAFSVY